MTISLDHEKIICATAIELGLGKNILILDLIGGCGVEGQLFGKLWRVKNPARGKVFVICLADKIGLGEVESLGLDKQTPFVCQSIALSPAARAFIEEAGTWIALPDTSERKTGVHTPSKEPKAQ